MNSNQPKYRAWDGERMMYPKNAFQDAGSSTFVLLMDMEGRASWNNPYGFHAEKPAHVEFMQSISVNDKTGTEIHEGDVIRTERGDWGVVVRNGHCFEVTISKDQSSLYGKEFLEKSTIIGNIKQNPELLNQP